MLKTLFKIIFIGVCVLVGIYLYNTRKPTYDIELPSSSEISEFTSKVIKYHMDKTLPATILVEDKRYYKVIDTTNGPTGVLSYINEQGDTLEGDTLELVKDFLKSIEIKPAEDINPKIEGIFK